MEGAEDLPFFSGDADEFQFVRQTSREVCLMLVRHAPIGTAQYRIVCAVEPGTLEISPQYAYEATMRDLVSSNKILDSVDPAYDLWEWDQNGIYGINLEEQTRTLLQDWESLSHGDNAVNSSRLVHSAVGLADGRLLFQFYDYAQKQYLFAVLTPSVN